RMRTITHFTTFPSFTWLSGDASFTDAVTMSPSPAFSPASPPMGRMHMSLRAPELSATVSQVRIMIIGALRYPIRLLERARISASRQRFRCDMGRVSTMRTVSPFRASPCSSWAYSLFVLRSTRPYSRCRTLRVTWTTMVFAIEALVTTPTLDCRRLRSISAALFSISHLQLAFAEQRLDPGEITPHHPQLLEAFRLPGGVLEAQAEDLLGEFPLVHFEFPVAHLANLFDAARHQATPTRVTNLVRMGSLCAATSQASRAVGASRPSSSNMMRPGRTTATQNSGKPLPLPMRVSAGFLVNGLSGKMRIHILPPRFRKRERATRAASIWRLVIQAGSMALSPQSPNARVLPRQAFPLRRPRICLRYFTFFGINMASRSSPHRRGLVPQARTRPARLFLSPRHVFALVDPTLHTDHAVGGVGLGETVINVGAQRLERQPALQVPFLARDFRAVQPSRHSHLDTLAPEPQRRINRFPHGTAERGAFLELQGNVFRHELRVQLRPVDFLDLDVHLALGAVLDFGLQLIDFRALAADDD